MVYETTNHTRDTNSVLDADGNPVTTPPPCSICSKSMEIVDGTPVEIATSGFNASLVIPDDYVEGFAGVTCGSFVVDALKVDEMSEQCSLLKEAEDICCPASYGIEVLALVGFIVWCILINPSYLGAWVCRQHWLWGGLPNVCE